MGASRQLCDTCSAKSADGDSQMEMVWEQCNGCGTIQNFGRGSVQSWDAKKSSADKVQWHSEMTEIILKLQEKNVLQS